MRRALSWTAVLLVAFHLPSLHARPCIPPGPRVALTFDDGPFATRTDEILAVLALHGARATFFMVGQRVDRHPQIAWRVWEQGHELGVHTWSHKDLARISPATRRQEIDRGHAAISAAVPTARIAWWRAPYGSQPHLGQISARVHGMEHRLWDVDTLDWQGASPQVLLDRTLSQLKPGDVVLMHDHGRGTLAMLDALLVSLHTRGYQAVQVSELAAPTCPPLPVEIQILDPHLAPENPPPGSDL